MTAKVKPKPSNKLKINYSAFFFAGAFFAAFLGADFFAGAFFSSFGSSLASSAFASTISISLSHSKKSLSSKYSGSL
jgi:hypothetical protein